MHDCIQINQNNMKGHCTTEAGSTATHRIAHLPHDKRVLDLIPALGLSIWVSQALVSSHSPKA